MTQVEEGKRWKVTKAVRASDLPAPSRHIMLTLADIADVGTAEIPERYTPSLSQLARETGLDKSTVARHLNLLEAAGWLARLRPSNAEALGRGERTKYCLLIPSGSVQLPSGTGRQPSGVEPLPLSQEKTTPVAQRDTGTDPYSDQSQITTSPSDSSMSPAAQSTGSEIEKPERSEIEDLCRQLADAIEANGYKRPTITKQWRTDMRLLVDRDGRSVVNIGRAISWATDDDFWRQNVLSPGKLRKHYDRMADQAAQQKRAANGATVSTTDARMAMADEALAKFKERTGLR